MLADLSPTNSLKCRKTKIGKINSPTAKLAHTANIHCSSASVRVILVPPVNNSIIGISVYGRAGQMIASEIVFEASIIAPP